MENHKPLIYIFTAIIDIYLVTLLYLQSSRLHLLDKWFIIVVLISHVLLYASLYTHNLFGIDFCHWMLIVCVGISPMLLHKALLLFCFVFIVFIQILWLVFDDCILLMSKNHTFGFGDLSSILAIIWMLILYGKLTLIDMTNDSLFSRNGLNK